MLRMSEEFKEIAAALAKAQGAIQNAIADSHNDYYNSNYADLGAVWNVVRKPLSDNGLAVVQIPTTTVLDGLTPPTVMLKLTTRIFHETGQYIESDIDFPVQRRKSKKGASDEETPAVPGLPTAQDLAAVVTYLRRITLAAHCGVAQEDDDGNRASGHGDDEGDPPPRRSSAPQAPTAGGNNGKGSNGIGGNNVSGANGKSVDELVSVLTKELNESKLSPEKKADRLKQLEKKAQLKDLSVLVPFAEFIRGEIAKAAA